MVIGAYVIISYDSDSVEISRIVPGKVELELLFCSSSDPVYAHVRGIKLLENKAKLEGVEIIQIGKHSVGLIWYNEEKRNRWIEVYDL